MHKGKGLQGLRRPSPAISSAKSDFGFPPRPPRRTNYRNIDFSKIYCFPCAEHKKLLTKSQIGGGDESAAKKANEDLQKVVKLVRKAEQIHKKLSPPVKKRLNICRKKASAAEHKDDI